MMLKVLVKRGHAPARLDRQGARCSRLGLRIGGGSREQTFLGTRSPDGDAVFVCVRAGNRLGRAGRAGRGGSRPTPALHRGGDGHGHRAQARGEPPVGALLGGRADAAGAPEPGCGEHRGRLGERRRLLGPEPRSRPEPDRDAGRIGGPDRARSAGCQGTGRRLSRRVGHLAVAVHAGPRPVRHVSHRGVARPAGNAVRVGIAVGHGALHHEPAGARRHRGGWRARLQLARRRRAGQQRQVRRQRAARARRGGPRHRVQHRGRRLHRCRAAGPARQGKRRQRPAHGRPRGAARATERALRLHPAARLPGRGDGRLEPDRRVQHPGQSVHHHAARGSAG